MTREPVDKTLKMYVGGAFIRSESGRTDPAGDRLRVNRASQDLRSAVEIAGKAQPGWAKATASSAARSSTASPRCSRVGAMP